MIYIVLLVLILSIYTQTTMSFSVSNNKSKSNIKSPIYALNVKFTLKPEKRNNFLSIIRKDQEQTLTTEPGVIQFVIGEDIETPNTFYLHEEYKSKEDFEYHCQTNHFMEWSKFCEEEEPFTSDPEIDFYSLCNSNSDGSSSSSSIDSAKVSPTSNLFCLNVKLCIDPTLRDEFLKVIDNNQNGSRTAEPLCLQYDYGECTSTENTFYFHEEYKGDDNGKEGFDAHASSPHFAAWEEFASNGNPFTEPPVVQKFVSI
mmetsp:Transcript_25417/g.31316  ORF Transcript_25417/g.31316 Transcript_25417/m.31316 type:complete len:257 (+) Transcript_25417:40-810(+)